MASCADENVGDAHPAGPQGSEDGDALPGVVAGVGGATCVGSCDGLDVSSACVPRGTTPLVAWGQSS